MPKLKRSNVLEDLDLPLYLSKLLNWAGIQTIKDLLEKTPQEIKDIEGLKPEDFEILERELNKYNFNFQ